MLKQLTKVKKKTEFQLPSDVPTFDDAWFARNVTYLTTPSQIEASASALLAKFELDATDNFITIELGLDLEWFVPTVNGRAIGPGGETDLIQVAYYEEEEGVVKVLLYHITNITSLPLPLKRLLSHPQTRFTGSNVSGDLARLNRGHLDLDLDVRTKAVDLETMAKRRGVVLASKGLDGICYSLFGRRVSKCDRLENWNQRPLPIKLKKYAALDAAWSLTADRKLRLMTDFVERLSPSQITGGMLKLCSVKDAALQLVLLLKIRRHGTTCHRI